MAHLQDQRSRLADWSEFMGKLPLLGKLWVRALSNRSELKRFLKFAAVGALGSVVDFAVLNVAKGAFEAIRLGEGWAISIAPHQTQLILANTISFSAAVLSNFTWNRLWTFPESRQRPLSSQLLKFTVVNVLGWAINTVLLVVMDRFVFQQLVGPRLSYNLAKAFAIGVVLFWNFGVNRIWTYRGIK